MSKPGNPSYDEMLRQQELRKRFEAIKKAPDGSFEVPGVDEHTGERVCPDCHSLAPKPGCNNCFHSVSGTKDGEDPFEPNPEATSK